MDHAQGVGKGEGLHQGQGDPQIGLRRQDPALGRQPGVQGQPLKEFHDDGGAAVLVHDVADLDDPGVLEVGLDPGLVQEALAQHQVLLVLLRQHLDGHGVAKPQVVTPVDPGHAPLANELVGLVARQDWEGFIHGAQPLSQGKEKSRASSWRSSSSSCCTEGSRGTPASRRRCISWYSFSPAV